MKQSPPSHLQGGVPSPSSPTPGTLAPRGMVLPHDDPEPNLLADQASHLTLSAPSGAIGSGPHRAAPGRRSRACSACSAFTASKEGEHSLHPSPPAAQHHRPQAVIDPLGMQNATVTPAADNDNAQRSPLPPASAPLMSHEHSHGHARECAAMRDVAAGERSRDEQQRRRMPPAEHDTPVSSLVSAGLVPVARDPWPANAFRLPTVDAKIMTLVDLPNEVLLHILGYLEVCDLLATSRVSDSRVATCEIVAPDMLVPFFSPLATFLACVSWLVSSFTAAADIHPRRLPCATYLQ